MFFESWQDLINMGGYGFYVWLSYGLSLGSIVILIVQSLRSRKSILAQVRREQQREARLKQANQGNTL